MKHLTTMFLLVTSLLISGCGGGSIASHFGGGGTAGATGEYTILLYTINGPDHVRNSIKIKKQTIKKTGWRNIYVNHKDSRTELRWGSYDTVTDAANDLNTARAWKTDKGLRAFRGADVIPISGKPIGNPEWDISNARGSWTVLIALFIDSPENRVVGRLRKEQAAIYCKWLRKKGFEAYYQHRRARSRVTIGAFPEDAVIMRKNPIPNQEDKDVLAYSSAVVNKTMAKIMNTKEPPLRHLIVNGRSEVAWQTLPNGKRQRITTRTYPMRIPNVTDAR